MSDLNKVFRFEGKNYDVSKLSSEAQVSFVTLAELQQGSLRRAELEYNVLKAAQAKLNEVVIEALVDEAIIEEPEPEEET